MPRPSTTCKPRAKPWRTVHLRYLNPLPKDLGDILKRFKKVLIPELNLGQLRTIIRAKYLVDAIGLNKVQGKPFSVAEVVDEDRSNLRGDRRNGPSPRRTNVAVANQPEKPTTAARAIQDRQAAEPDETCIPTAESCDRRITTSSDYMTISYIQP